MEEINKNDNIEESKPVIEKVSIGDINECKKNELVDQVMQIILKIK